MRIPPPLLMICFSLFVSTIFSSAQTVLNQQALDAVKLLNQWREDHPDVWAEWHSTGRVFGQDKDNTMDVFRYTENGATAWRISVELKLPKEIKMVAFPGGQSGVSVFFPKAKKISDLNNGNAGPDFCVIKFFLRGQIDLDALPDICTDISLDKNGGQRQLHFALRPQLYEPLPPSHRSNFKPEIVFTFDDDGRVDFVTWIYRHDSQISGKLEYRSFENGAVQENAPVLPSGAMIANRENLNDAILSEVKAENNPFTVGNPVTLAIIGFLIGGSLSFLAILRKKTSLLPPSDQSRQLR